MVGALVVRAGVVGEGVVMGTVEAVVGAGIVVAGGVIARKWKQHNGQ